MFQELGMFSDSIGMFSSDVNQLPAPSLNLDFTTGVLDSRITYTRAQAVANTVTYTGSNGLIQYATANTARFDYNPITLACNGLLIEESRANIFLYASDYTQSAWAKAQATITSSAAIAPDGTLTANAIVEDSTLAAHRVSQAVSVSTGVTYTFSAYVKKVTTRYFQITPGTPTYFPSGCGAWFDLNAVSYTAGTSTTASITSVGNGWYRCTATIAATGTGSVSVYFNPSSTNGNANYQGTAGVTNVYLWGAQLEAGAFATSLIQTTSTSITRNADNASMTGTNFSSWFNASQGTLVSIAIPYNVSAIRGGFVVSDGTANNTIETAHGSTPRAFINTGGVTQLSQASGSVAANSIVKSAISYQANNANGACNGVAGTAVLSCSIPTVNKAIIGNVYDGSSALNGTISKIIAYTVRLPDNTLKGLTS